MSDDATPKQGVMGRLLQQSGLYALANLVLKLSGLVLVPLYLNLLSAEAYGHFALLDATARVAILVAGLGLATGLLRFMTNEAYEAERAALPFTALAMTTLAALGLCGLVWLLAPTLAALLIDDPGGAVLVRLMGAYAACKVIEAIPMMLMRTAERVGLYLAASLLEVLVLVGGVFLFLVAAERGLRGVMEAYALSAGVGTVVLVGATLSRIPWRFRARLVAPLIRFGTPLVLAGLASLFMNVGDRYLLKAFESAAVVGVYDWAARLGGALNMLFVNSFQLAFGVIGLKVLGASQEGVAVYRRTFRHFVIWTGWSVLGLALLARDFTALVSTKDAYLAAADLVLPIALGFMAYGIYNIMMNILFVRGRTSTIALMIFGSALCNAALNVVLIPWLGAVGAAVSTTLAYGLLMALGARAAQQQMRIDYAWGKLAVVVALVVGLYLLGRPTTPWPWPARLAARGALILAYLPLLRVTGLYSAAEVRQGWQLLRARLPRRG